MLHDSGVIKKVSNCSDEWMVYEQEMEVAFHLIGQPVTTCDRGSLIRS